MCVCRNAINDMQKILNVAIFVFFYSECVCTENMHRLVNGLFCEILDCSIVQKSMKGMPNFRLQCG